MSNIPPLDYFMEQEKAKIATKKFCFILQEAFKEYKKVWNMYINLVKHCEENNFISFSKDKSETRQKDKNHKCTENMNIDEQDMTNSFHSMEDILAQCTLDLDCSMEKSYEGKGSKKTKRDISASPIFERNNSNFQNSALRRSNSISDQSRSIITDDNLSNNNEQENSERVHSVLNASSTTNVPSIFLCSTPTKSHKWDKSRKQNIKRNAQSKKTMSFGNLKKKNNLVSIKKGKANKIPLQIINNVISVPKKIHQTDKNNINKSYNIQITMSPNSRKLKQTKLDFHKTKKATELSNNLKSSNISEVTKTNMPICDQDRILNQSTLTDRMDLQEKSTNDKRIENTYDQLEISNDITKNKFVYIHTNAQIKDEIILVPEYEQVNPTETNDPLNTSNESDSTFFEENECNIGLNKNSFNFKETYAPPMRNESKTTNDNFEKRHINSLEIEKNIVETNNIEVPIKKKGPSKLGNDKCSECKQNGKKHCVHHRNMSHKGRNIATSSSTLLPDSPSSTT